VRDYGRVYSKFWTSDDMQALTDDGRMLALYLLSGPHGTIAGVCRLPDGYVSEDLKWSIERVAKGLQELSVKGFADRCETAKWVWIRKYLEWNTPENPNQWKAARKIAASVPSNCSWKALFDRAFAIAAGDVPPIDKNPLPTVPKQLPTQDQEKEQKQEQDSSRAVAPRGTDAERHANFEKMKALYPLCVAANWLLGEKFSSALVSNGESTWPALIENAGRYGAYCKATGCPVTNPKNYYVDKSKWSETWPIPTKPGAPAKSNDDAAWAEATTLAKEIGFREPHRPAESVTSYMREVTQFRDRPPEVPLSERRGLAGIKRIGAT
jgi:hypothetical protein